VHCGREFVPTVIVLLKEIVRLQDSPKMNDARDEMTVVQRQEMFRQLIASLAAPYPTRESIIEIQHRFQLSEEIGFYPLVRIWIKH